MEKIMNCEMKELNFCELIVAINGGK